MCISQNLLKRLIESLRLLRGTEKEEFKLFLEILIV